MTPNSRRADVRLRRRGRGRGEGDKAVETKAPEGMGGVERLMSVAGQKGKKKGKR